LQKINASSRVSGGCMRIAFALVVMLGVALPCRAETLRSPVDDAVWRTLEGSGADARPWPTTVGWPSTVVGALAIGSVAFMGAYMMVWVLPSLVGSADGALFFTGVAYTALSPTVAAILGLEGLVTQRTGQWWIGALIAPVLLFLPMLGGAAISALIPGGGGGAIALGALTSVVLTGIGCQVAAFGFPVNDD